MRWTSAVFGLLAAACVTAACDDSSDTASPASTGRSAAHTTATTVPPSTRDASTGSTVPVATSSTPGSSNNPSTPGDAAAPAATSVPAPDPATARAALDVYDGGEHDVRGAVADAREARGIAARGDRDACARVLDWLRRRHDFDDLRAGVAQMPDPYLGELAMTAFGSTVGALDACAAGDDSEPLVVEGSASDERLRARLDQLEEAR